MWWEFTKNTGAAHTPRWSYSMWKEETRKNCPLKEGEWGMPFIWSQEWSNKEMQSVSVHSDMHEKGIQIYIIYVVHWQNLSKEIQMSSSEVKPQGVLEKQMEKSHKPGERDSRREKPTGETKTK